MDPSSHGETGPGLTLLDVFVMIIVLGVAREITNMNIGITVRSREKGEHYFPLQLMGFKETLAVFLFPLTF